MNGLNKLLVSLFFAVALQLPFATLLHAQSSPDTRSPLIELDAVAEAQADNSQVFTAQVVDDRILRDVLLYYRRSGQQAFTPIVMTPIGSTSYYTASLDTTPEDLRAIEYYVQARDEAGNRTVEGFAFDPYTRVLTANNALSLATNATPAAPSQTATSSLRWWHVAAGVLIVGALASAANGSSDSGTNEETAPLTFNLSGP